MKASIAVGGRRLDLDLASPVDLSLPVSFDAAGRPAAEPFGAPRPIATVFRAGTFTGDVRQGGSCNCHTIAFTPHASGTHTECVGHLTHEAVDAWKIVPYGLLPAVLVAVAPSLLADGDSVISAAALEAAWPAALPFNPVAAVIRSGFDRSSGSLANPAYLEPQAARFLVRQGIEHLVVDLPSLDRREDGGELAAHRAFFGLPAGSKAFAEARGARHTVTELAAVPPSLPSGPCLLALQVPAITGDAVPSRPLLYAVMVGGAAA